MRAQIAVYSKVYSLTKMVIGEYSKELCASEDNIQLKFWRLFNTFKKTILAPYAYQTSDWTLECGWNDTCYKFKGKHNALFSEGSTEKQGWERNWFIDVIVVSLALEKAAKRYRWTQWVHVCDTTMYFPNRIFRTFRNTKLKNWRFPAVFQLQGLWNALNSWEKPLNTKRNMERCRQYFKWVTYSWLLGPSDGLVIGNAAVNVLRKRKHGAVLWPTPNWVESEAIMLNSMEPGIR